MTPTTWRKSTRSNDPEGNCVEVAFAPAGAAVRDSKDPAGPILTFSPRVWRSFARSRRMP
jgi:hypothetical protein